MRPLQRLDGYLPIEDHGLIGDGNTAALVGRDGGISWLCAPRFDSPPVFCALLDHRRGGTFLVAPDGLRACEQHYVPDTGVLVTVLEGPRGTVEITDAMLLDHSADLREDKPAQRHALRRCVRVRDGEVALRVEVMPRGRAEFAPTAGGVAIRLLDRPELPLCLHASRPLAGARTVLPLKKGDTLELALCWGAAMDREEALSDAAMHHTIDVWRRWTACVHYEGPQRQLVRRSAVTLKMLDYLQNGALVAAPTSSLPEHVGGIRNWDYRYAWVRDAAFSTYAFSRIGMEHEAFGFLSWVMDAVERHGQPSVLYTLDGDNCSPEREDPELEGYRHSRPVRWGNGAAAQKQNDVYGEILDCAWQWVRAGREIDDLLWGRLSALADTACREWRSVDHGIWEVRSAGKTFTYSAALCHVAVDRAVRLAKQLGREGDVARWQRTANDIQRAILEEAWDEKKGALTFALGGDCLDASVLALPLRRVIDANHPKMKATVEAIRRELSPGHDLLYRYHPERLDDGLTGDEGAFLLCSFWLVDNLVMQGALDEAEALFEKLCRRASPLGLLSEEIDPSTGLFLGNFPQAFSHVGVISSGVNLWRARRGTPPLAIP